MFPLSEALARKRLAATSGLDRPAATRIDQASISRLKKRQGEEAPKEGNDAAAFDELKAIRSCL